jgi:hypothetical protein
MSRSTDAAIRALSRRGEVKTSAADALRAAVSPPKEPNPEMTWYEVALELKRANDAFEAQRQAEAEAEANRPPPAQTAAQMLGAAIGGSSSGTIPLNGAALLGSVIRGMGANGGTINGEPS